MTYMGTIDSSNATSSLTNNARWGSTYKVSGDITSPVVAKTGDLVIAEKAADDSVEGAANSTTWVVVPSGDDQTINFTTNVSTGLVSVDDGVSGAGIQVAAGTHVAVTHSQSGNTITSTVAQAQDYTAQDVSGSTANQSLTAASSNTATTASFEAITAIETDAYGNVVD